MISLVARRGHWSGTLVHLLELLLQQLLLLRRSRVLRISFFFCNLEHCQRYESTMMPGIMSASELSNNMQIRRVCESGRNLFATKCRHSSYKHILVYVWYPTHTHTKILAGILSRPQYEEMCELTTSWIHTEPSNDV